MSPCKEISDLVPVCRLLENSLQVQAETQEREDAREKVLSTQVSFSDMNKLNLQTASSYTCTREHKRLLYSQYIHAHKTNNDSYAHGYKVGQQRAHGHGKTLWLCRVREIEGKKNRGSQRHKKNMSRESSKRFLLFLVAPFHHEAITEAAATHSTHTKVATAHICAKVLTAPEHRIEAAWR